jgi:hypothetical protein
MLKYRFTLVNGMFSAHQSLLCLSRNFEIGKAKLMNSNTYMNKSQELSQSNTRVYIVIATFYVAIYERFHFIKATLYGTF